MGGCSAVEFHVLMLIWVCTEDHCTDVTTQSPSFKNKLTESIYFISAKEINKMLRIKYKHFYLCIWQTQLTLHWRHFISWWIPWELNSWPWCYVHKTLRERFAVSDHDRKPCRVFVQDFSIYVHCAAWDPASTVIHRWMLFFQLGDFQSKMIWCFLFWFYGLIIASFFADPSFMSAYRILLKVSPSFCWYQWM